MAAPYSQSCCGIVNVRWKNPSGSLRIRCLRPEGAESVFMADGGGVPHPPSLRNLRGSLQGHPR
jgi:hypothetical protein